MPDLHHVVTLAVPNMLLLDVAAPAQFFGQLGAGRYRFELAGAMPGPIPTSTGLEVTAEWGLEALQDADTIVVPGVSDWETASFPKTAAALADAHERGARIMSICTGAFFLGEAGLLDGRRATTHWCATGVLAKRYPTATVEPDVLYVDEGSVLTSAGVGAALDLCLHVVRRDHGAAVAADFARWTVIAPHREGGQAQFIPSGFVSSGPSSAEVTTEQARTWALQHLDRPLSVAQLGYRRSFAAR